MVNELRTPFDVVTELRSIRGQAEKGLALLAEKERELVMLDLEADRVEAVTFLNAHGAVEIRRQESKLAALEARQAAELARIEVSRIKLKLKHLAEAQMAVQTSARMIELEWKG